MPRKKKDSPLRVVFSPKKFSAGKTLRSLRKRGAMSKGDLAFMLGVEKYIVTALESSIKFPRALAEELADIFQTDDGVFFDCNSRDK